MIEKLTKEELKDIEQGQLAKIKELDLVRRVFHDKWMDGKLRVIKKVETKSGRKVEACGTTMIELYSRDNLPFKEGKGFDYNDVEPISVGIAICSASENSYDKRQGRMRATGRALRAPWDAYIRTKKEEAKKNGK